MEVAWYPEFAYSMSGTPLTMQPSAYAVPPYVGLACAVDASGGQNLFLLRGVANPSGFPMQVVDVGWLRNLTPCGPMLKLGCSKLGTRSIQLRKAKPTLCGTAYADAAWSGVPDIEYGTLDTRRPPFSRSLPWVNAAALPG
ncbi:hypothetical protein LSTR_LSTR005657 [Laodelphax striatellus]|uniref:Uncharacterized protein n=1 Tax=Laodelphax striatellus TaxID=195883 RepID=A0A482WUP2_LAOST|nr:hypothetical protein LSTR_LSTR005657 [Laodelphax striatellus]